MDTLNDTITDLIDRIHNRLCANVLLASYDRDLLYRAEQILIKINTSTTDHNRYDGIQDMLDDAYKNWIRDNLEITAELSDSGGPGNCVDIGLKFKGEDRRFTSEHVYIPSDFPDDNF